MQRKVTIAIDETVYEGLTRIVGRGRSSRFIEDLVRPHVLGSRLEASYRERAGDAARERDATEWIDGLTGDMVRQTLRRAVRQRGSAPRKLGRQISARFAGAGLTEPLPEWRDHRVEPTDLGQ